MVFSILTQALYPKENGFIVLDWYGEEWSDAEREFGSFGADIYRLSGYGYSSNKLIVDNVLFSMDPVKRMKIFLKKKVHLPLQEKGITTLLICLKLKELNCRINLLMFP